MAIFRIAPGADLESALKTEWLETNGLGGFASSTVVGLNTRRYHALLTAAMHPPVGRMVLLSKLEETLVSRAERFELGCNEYPGVIHPAGYRYLSEFRLDPFPVFVYKMRDLTIEKRVFMVDGANTTVVEYEIDGEDVGDVVLEVHPLIAFREFHSLTRRNDALDGQVQITSEQVSMQPYPDLPRLYVVHNATEAQATGEWYFNFVYRLEQERGLDFEEDLYQPFVLKFDLARNGSARVIASTEQHAIGEAFELREREIQRRARIVASSPENDSFTRSLVRAADQFIVKRGNLQTMIAGYHWFSDWGRDAMIALPALTLVTGRFETARNILRSFADVVDEGMLPNRWPDAGETPEYNTVDATLWFFEAVAALLRYTGDYGFVRTQLFERLSGIVDWHLRGTRFGIRVNEHGLVECGEPGSNLTWMDAKVGNHAVTPRIGMPVEIQALWYNALRIMELIASQLRDSRANEYAKLAAAAKRSFDALFWNESEDCLYDVIDGEARDASIRPNQIFAISLTYPILSGGRARCVVERVERDLLTPRGLRSLAASDPQYRGRYEGNPSNRDSAYHQGTVWSWLLGPFITAYLRVHERSTDARETARAWLLQMQEDLGEACLGQISEIFDGDAPHEPKGAIAQAWSIAETLRAWLATSETIARPLRGRTVPGLVCRSGADRHRVEQHDEPYD